MSDAPRILLHRDAAQLAAAAAARLVTELVDAQAARGRAHVVITGGGIGTGTLAALAGSAARDAIDWRVLDVWWGDERFLPEGDPDRNATQAREALLDAVPLDPARVHEMPASNAAFGPDVDTAAAWYAAQLAGAAGPDDHAGVPSFDVLMLGVGPDGHVASLFPSHPALDSADGAAIGVRGSPKPPPIRISLTLPAINQARQIWLLAAGAEKAGAVATALAQVGVQEGAPGAQDGPALPAARVHGLASTLWLLDRAAAAEVSPRRGPG
jgi:6-phosphogluconolactonase